MINENEKYCSECGAIISRRAEICPKCGCRVKGNSGVENLNEKWLITLLLCVFLGGFGVHRFYTGHTAIGIVQLLTGGGCGIWWIIDLIYIIVGNYKDSEGNLITMK